MDEKICPQCQTTYDGEGYGGYCSKSCWEEAQKSQSPVYNPPTKTEE